MKLSGTTSLGAAAVFVVAVASGCTSANFNVAPGGGGDGGDSAISGGDVLDDTPPAETPVDPCAPVAGVAKFCVKIAGAAAHPGYDSTSNADKLGVDGRGVVKVYLFSSDPGLKTPGLLPAATITYPSSGEISIDKDVPLTIDDAAPEGTYWFFVTFQDSTAPRGSGAEVASPGDFILVPTVEGEKEVFPQVTLTKGTTQSTDIPLLRPVRRVDADVVVGTKLHLDASANPNIHGDGPMQFLLYDGDLSGGFKTANFVDIAYSKDCINVNPKVAPTVPVSFGVAVDGSHKLFAALFDYAIPSSADYPGKGTMYTAAVGTEVPFINIGTTTWTTPVLVKLVADDAYGPTDTTPKEVPPFICRP